MSSSLVSLTPTDLDAIIRGGCFFGSGGGGTFESAVHLLRHFQDDYYPVREVPVVSVDAATEGETVMVAYMGAPAAIQDAKYPTGPVEAARQIQERLAAQGRTLRYVISPESGALGFLVAALVAAKLGLAVVDGDGAGRAVPCLPMLTYASAGVCPRPAFVVSQQGLCVELDVKPREGFGNEVHQQDVATIVEQMLRPIVGAPEFGQFGGLALWIMDPPTLQRAVPIRGTMRRALQLGRALRDGEIRTGRAMRDYLEAQAGIDADLVVERGRFQAASVDTSGGFDVGKLTLQQGAETCTVLYQNESLLLWSSEGGAPRVTAPDAIAYFVEEDDQHVYSNGDVVGSDGAIVAQLRGKPVSVLRLPADPALLAKGPGGGEGLILQSFLETLATMGYHGPYLGCGTRQFEEVRA